MDFVDEGGTRYQLSEETEAPTPPKKVLVWPWVVGGLALDGGLVWMASQTSRKPNPVTPETEALIAEARDPDAEWGRLWALFNHSEREVRRALLDNPNVCPTNADGQLDTTLLENLAEVFPEEVAAHPVFVLHALIEPNDKMIWVVKEVVERTEDVGLIERVFHSWGTSWGSVRRNVALNPNTPEDLLRTLGNEATESDKSVRQEVAKNPSTPEDVLRTLGNEATESEGRVRRVVAENPSTSVDLLRTLGNQKTESEWKVRATVASNPNTPGDTLRTLGNEATESEWCVRETVAPNPSTPEDLLRSLANEKTESNLIVRKAAQKALAERGLT